MSSISIIGTGNMAGALAGRALVGGNAVEIIGRGAGQGQGQGQGIKHTDFFLGVNILG